MDDRSVLVVSQRDVVRHPANATLYEFEDLIVEWENARLLEITRYHGDPRFDRRRRAYQALRSVGLDSRRSLRALRPSRAGFPERFDLAIIVTSGPYDLFVLDELPWIRDCCDQVIVYVIEAWPSATESPALLREPWELMDQAFVGLAPAAEALDREINVPVSFLPLGVDSLSFAASPSSARPVAVYNPGRRDRRQHAALASAAAEADLWYNFDTFSMPLMSASHVEHRALYAKLLGHSSTLICNRAKFDYPEAIVGGRPVAPSRLPEGLAAGCRLVGDSISADALNDLDLPPATVAHFPLAASTEDAAELLKRPVNPEERRASMELARRQLDWGWRWKAILNSLGLTPTESLDDRLRLLCEP